jgi:hypothetical protein
MAGRLVFADPRIPYCCPHEPGRVTGSARAEMRAGTMIVFASDYVHSVGPYRGVRPRMTMSWNVTIERLAGDAAGELAVTHCSGATRVSLSILSGPALRQLRGLQNRLRFKADRDLRRSMSLASVLSVATLHCENSPMSMRPFPFGPGIDVSGRVTAEFAEILTPEAMALAAKLQRAFGGPPRGPPRRAARAAAEFDRGTLPDFLPGDARGPRRATGPARRFPPIIVDRRVEITGPGRPQDGHQRAQFGRERVHGRFRDANTPIWDNNLQGKLNLRDAIAAGSITRRRRQGVRAQREDRRSVRPPARLASSRESTC